MIPLGTYPLRDVAREPRVGLYVFQHERRLGGGDPAGDTRGRRETLADEKLVLLAGDGGEDELVRFLVEEKDRRPLSAEDRAGDLDDRS